MQVAVTCAPCASAGHICASGCRGQLTSACLQYVQKQREMVSGPIQPGQSFQDPFPLSESAQARLPHAAPSTGTTAALLPSPVQLMAPAGQLHSPKTLPPACDTAACMRQEFGLQGQACDAQMCTGAAGGVCRGAAAGRGVGRCGCACGRHPAAGGCGVSALPLGPPRLQHLD